MIGTALVSLLKSPWMWVAIIIVGLSYYAYGLYLAKQELEHQNQVRRQNIAALEDSLTKKADSIQTMVLFVRDLNTQLKDKDSELAAWKNKYRILNTKYQIVLVAIRDTGETQGTIDSGFAITTFQGTKFFAHYQGKTIFDLRTQIAEWELDLQFDDINTESDVFLEDSLWKIQTVSLTPGVKVRGISTIDDKTLRDIRHGGVAVDGGRNFLAVGSYIAYDRVYAGVVLKPSNWQFSFSYKLFDKKDIQNEPIQDRIMIGVHYSLF